MKKYVFLLMLLPLIGMSQTKTVINTTRLFPKLDKIAELEKALTVHAQKYHTGDWSWRVYAIISGPDAGGFHIVEGPNTWTALDSRGNLGAEHTADLNKNVLPLTAESRQSYSVLREDLSNIPSPELTEKISITHVFPKQGESHKVENRIKKLKKVWEAGNVTVAVFESHLSGPFQFALVTRHKDGWKEKEKTYRKPIKERYESVYGEGSYIEFLETGNSSESAWGEMLVLRPDLGSK
jgi:hypothetical protein